MNDEAKSFVVYDDIEAVLDELTDEQVGRLFRGMVSYHSSGEDPEFDGVLKYVFIPIKQGIDRNAEKYQKRCEKNRENVRKRYEKVGLEGFQSTNVYDGIRSNTMATNSNSNTNTNTNTNSKSNTNTKSTEVDVWALSRSVLSHLNKEAGTSYRVDDAEYVRLISDLSHKGYTESQMIEVIDKKCADWLGDPKVEQYLRPRTLFGQKFEEYLNAPVSAKLKERAEKKKQQDREMAELQRGTEALNRLFEKGQARHEQFMREHGLRSEAANE